MKCKEVQPCNSLTCPHSHQASTPQLSLTLHLSLCPQLENQSGFEQRLYFYAMHLINARTLQLEDYVGHVPPYVALSHTWGPEEVTFGEMTSGKDFHFQKRGFSKITACCDMAQKYGYDFAWIDTCCIDKRSSAELTEAINSMYKWYQQAHMCFAYLEDVRSTPLETRKHGNDIEASGFIDSRWFTRGWTLQELLAPRNVEFFSRDWVSIGTKFGLRELLSTITQIDINALSGRSIHSFSVAEKMSWTARRQTTRVEDQAYCLLGIFNVNMPLMYGEGQYSFKRLQHEILRQREDHSIFLWSLPMQADTHGLPLLSTAPAGFSSRIRMKHYPSNEVAEVRLTSLTRISRFSGQQFVRDRPKIFPDAIAPLASDPPAITNRGLSISLNVMELQTRQPSEMGTKWAWTFYTMEDRFVCIRLVQRQVDNGIVHFRVGDIQLVATSEIQSASLQTLYLALDPIATEPGSDTTGTSQVYQEPTLVLQGIQPGPEFMLWWNTIVVENRGPKSWRKDFQYILKSSLSMEENQRSNESENPEPQEVSQVEDQRSSITENSSDAPSPKVEEIFKIIPKLGANEKPREGLAIVLGSLGPMMWCKILPIKEFPEKLRSLKGSVEGELRTHQLTDQAVVPLQSGERAIVQIRPERSRSAATGLFVCFLKVV